MWCSSAVNRSPFFCSAACRTRPSAAYARVRPCVRSVVACGEFRSASRLPSSPSAACLPALFGTFFGVGSGEAAELGSATSARPSELPVQFSRRQLSPGVALLAVVARHARDQLQEVDQPEFPVELCPRQLLPPPTAAPSFVAPAPDASQNPTVQSVEQPTDVCPPVIIAPPPDDRVQLVQQPSKLLRVTPIGNLADPLLEALDRAVTRVGVQVGFTLSEA